MQKAKTRQEIAAEYGIDPRTLQKWLQKHQVAIPTGAICPKDQERIYAALGQPKEETSRKR